MRLSAGPFLAAAGVQTDKTGEAVKEFFNELNRDRHADAGRRAEEGEELRRARVSRASSRPPATWRASSRSSSSTTCPTTRSRSSCSAVTSVTAADLQRLAARYIQPDKMAVVVVGDRKVDRGTDPAAESRAGQLHHDRRAVPVDSWPLLPGPFRLWCQAPFAPINVGAMSEFRVEKRREAAEVTLVTGATVSGVFFLAGSSQLHSGPERVGDVLNFEAGFFPFESGGETTLINRAHVLKVALPPQMIEAQLDAGYDVATRAARQGAADDRRNDHRSRRRLSSARPRSSERLRAHRRALSLRRARRIARC